MDGSAALSSRRNNFSSLLQLSGWEAATIAADPYLGTCASLPSQLISVSELGCYPQTLSCGDF